ncbi:MAG: hypothetical protein JWN38_1216 [Candidatus Saccharibacteria bacterium]|nr:hypothetical protein [Candidatus Saccharibacteria bacterium]
MPKPKNIKKLPSVRLKAAIMAALVLLSFGIATVVHADVFDDQINDLNNQNSSAQNNLNELFSQASSYQAAIQQLDAQIAAVQAQIAANEAEQTRIQGEIVKNQADIDQKKATIGASVKAMYLDDQMTTIEQLATSKDLSDYIDKEEYRSAVQKQLDASIKEINALQAQLATQKTQIDQLVASQKVQNAQLSQAQAQQASLLAYNQSQQDAFNGQIAANSGKIKQLRAAQAAANAALSGGKVIGGAACDSAHGDTYPAKWCSIAQDSVIDAWGMYNRECVSYTAWKVYESGRHMPYWGGVGNANQWDDNARAAGIPVSTTPRTGDVAISNAGAYGHALYVEYAYGDGSILVSDYNQQYDGVYRRYTIPAATVSAKNLQFIHF